MFSEPIRSTLKDKLIEIAKADGRVMGVALTGSSSTGAEDRWSDIDLALGVAGDSDIAEVINEWTHTMYQDFDAVDHFDVKRESTTYRVFLLENSLQIDISFSPEDDFGAVGPTFRLVAGTSSDQKWTPNPDPRSIIGMAWLYALHARSSIARGRLWQAEFMISAIRDQVLALACLRHGLPAHQGRGIDDLPSEAIRQLEGTLIGQLSNGDLLKKFGRLTEVLIAEVAHVDENMAERLTSPLRELVTSASA